MRSTACNLALLCALLSCSCEPLYTTWGDLEEMPILAKKGAVAPEVPTPLRLKVMTWNIKYGAGRIDFWFDLWGDRVEMSLDEVEANMDAIYRLINEVHPDILVTNEIEVNSKRSAYYDMVKGVLENTDLRWAAYTPVWQAKYVPTEGLGRVDMGNCVFSRFPIVKSERIAQVDRTDQDPVTRAFYLHRAVGRAVVDVGGRQLAVYAVHTEAYDQDGTNARQQRQILELIRAETLPFVLAGDLNAVPPTSVKLEGFPDERPEAKGTDFAPMPFDPTDLVPFYAEFSEAITLARYGTTEEEQSRYFTHSLIGEGTIGTDGKPGFWSRKLDYLFIKGPDAWGATDVLQRPGDGEGLLAHDGGLVSKPIDLSDHCPLAGVWEVNR